MKHVADRPMEQWDGPQLHFKSCNSGREEKKTQDRNIRLERDREKEKWSIYGDK